MTVKDSPKSQNTELNTPNTSAEMNYMDTGRERLVMTRRVLIVSGRGGDDLYREGGTYFDWCVLSAAEVINSQLHLQCCTGQNDTL